MATSYIIRLQYPISCAIELSSYSHSLCSKGSDTDAPVSRIPRHPGGLIHKTCVMLSIC